jgi:hypothetical protein
MFRGAVAEFEFGGAHSSHGRVVACEPRGPLALGHPAVEAASDGPSFGGGLTVLVSDTERAQERVNGAGFVLVNPWPRTSARRVHL